jgi:LmbE family N-acetylglucosaminyl deacetylase
MIAQLRGRIVVVSPHLDDAVLSVGATIAGGVRDGASIEVLTAIACDPDSRAPAGPWDVGSGFATEGESARVRREEDRAACRILGATPRWLPFADEQYDRHGGDQEVWSAVAAATAGADTVMLPGSPLINPDHAWLSELLLRRGLDCGRIVLYAEQPYVFQERKAGPPPVTARALESVLGAAPSWLHFTGSGRDRRLKLRAANAYRSQLRQLGLGFFGLRRMLHHELELGGEALAWLA